MNEPMMMLSRDRDGNRTRLFAPPQTMQAAARAGPDRARRFRLRLLGGWRPEAPQARVEPAV